MVCCGVCVGPFIGQNVQKVAHKTSLRCPLLRFMGQKMVKINHFLVVKVRFSVEKVVVYCENVSENGPKLSHKVSVKCPLLGFKGRFCPFLTTFIV